MNVNLRWIATDPPYLLPHGLILSMHIVFGVQLSTRPTSGTVGIDVASGKVLERVPLALLAKEGNVDIVTVELTMVAPG